MITDRVHVLSAQHHGPKPRVPTRCADSRALAQRLDTQVSCPQFIHAANSPRGPGGHPGQQNTPGPKPGVPRFRMFLKSLIAAQFTGHGSTNTPPASYRPAGTPS